MQGPQGLALVKPHRKTHTQTDTISITPGVLRGWLEPPFQRPLRVNEKVRAISEQIKADMVVPGVLTLGVLAGKTYLLDGQHRIEAFRLADIPEAFADIRIHHVDDMAQMGEEFVRINSSIVRLRPDDILRGLEGSLAPLATLRSRCKFVGYDMIRRGPQAPLLSMAATIRCWFFSQPEVPSGSGGSAIELARRFSSDDSVECSNFLLAAFSSWGRDPEYQRVWSNLNLTLCMWLYRRLVLTQHSPKIKRMAPSLFEKCLMSLTADRLYMDWLVGRLLNDRDRSPGFQRIKSIFARRLFDETGVKAMLPSPSWAHGGGIKNR